MSRKAAGETIAEAMGDEFETSSFICAFSTSFLPISAMNGRFANAFASGAEHAFVIKNAATAERICDAARTP